MQSCSIAHIGRTKNMFDNYLYLSSASSTLEKHLTSIQNQLIELIRLKMIW